MSKRFTFYNGRVVAYDTEDDTYVPVIAQETQPTEAPVNALWFEVDENGDVVDIWINAET